MTTTTWNFTIDGRPHTVRLQHGYLLGKSEIWVDGRSIERGKKLCDDGSYHTFTIDGRLHELGILTNGVTFSYFLVQDGKPIPSDRDREKGKTSENLVRSRYLRDIQLWKDLSRLLGISYQPEQNATWTTRHRLLGMWKGFLVEIRKGVNLKINADIWFVLVRHAPFASKEKAELIITDQRVMAVLGKLAKKKEQVLEVAQNYTVIFLPVIKKETTAELVGRIQTFLSALAQYVGQLKTDECENVNCSHRPDQQAQLLMVNGFPQFLCQDCINALPGMVKQQEEAYKKAPTYLSAGFLAGIGTALLGAMVWAGSVLAAPSLAGASIMLIIWGLFWVFERVGTKRSALAISTIAVLTLASIFLGQLLAIFLMLIRDGMPLGSAVLVAAWRRLMENPAMLTGSLMFTLLLLGIILAQVWTQYYAARKQSSQLILEELEKRS